MYASKRGTSPQAHTPIVNDGCARRLRAFRKTAAGGKHPQPKGAQAARSIVVLRKGRQGEEFDALLGQGLGFLARRLAVDAAGGGLLVVDLARLLGEARADVLRLGLDLGSQLAHGG